MDDININLDPNLVPPVTDFETTPPSTPTNIDNQPSDTLSAAVTPETNPLSIFFQLEKPIYLNVWSKVINLATQQAREQILSDQTLDIAALKGMRLNALLTAEALINLQTNLDDIAKAMKDSYDAQKDSVDNVNPAIDDFNDEISDQTDNDQDAIDTMNDATVAYNASDKGPAATVTYTFAITAYSVYVNSTRVTNYNNSTNSLSPDLDTYQTNVDQQNSTIDEINILRQEVGIPPLPHIANAPSIPAQTSMPSPPSTASPTILPDATNPTPIANVANPTVPPTSAQLIAQYATPILESIIPTMESQALFFQLLTDFRDYERYYLGPMAGKISTLPNSFIDQTTQIFLDQSVNVGSGAGVSLASMIAGLSSGNLNRILSNSIANDAAKNANIPLSPELLDNIRLINLTLLSRAALGSSIPAFSLLAERAAFMDADSPAVPIAISLAFAIQIAALSVAQDLQETILAQLKSANPTADSKKLAELAGTLTAASNLSFALFAVSQLAQSLKFPELTGQLLSLIDSKATTSAVSSASTTTVGDVLNNPSSVSYLKADLANTLAGYGKLSQDEANDIANRLILSDIKNESQLSDAIAQQLTRAGISQDEATALAGRGTGFVRSEIDSANVLDTTIQKELVQHDYLTKQLQKNNIDSDTIAKIISDTDNASYTSRRELREGIAKNLQNTGLTPEESRHIANDIVRNNQSGVLTYEPVTVSQLAGAVISHVTSQAGADFGVPQSQQLANSLVNVLFSDDPSKPSSITNIIRDNVKALNVIDDAHFADAIRDNIKPTYDLYHYSNKIMNPAYIFTHSIWTGIIYSSKFKHTESIDIIV